MNAARLSLRLPILRRAVGLASLLVMLTALVSTAALNVGLARTSALLAYVEQYGEGAQTRLLDVDRRRDILILNHTDCQVAWLRDGETLLLTRTPPGEMHQVYRIGIDRTNGQVLTSGGVHNEAPSLSPDGEWVAFSANRRGQNMLYRVRVDGSGLQPIGSVPMWVTRTRWSPDGTKLAANGIHANRFASFYLLDHEAGTAESLTQSDLANWSPDGTHIAYSRHGADGARLVVRELASGYETQLTHADEAISPVWSPDGARIAYVRASGEGRALHIVELATRTDHALTAIDYADMPLIAWSSDGHRLAFSARYREVENRFDRLAPYNLYMLNADGSGLTRIRRGFGAYVNNFSRFCALAWSP